MIDCILAFRISMKKQRKHRNNILSRETMRRKAFCQPELMEEMLLLARLNNNLQLLLVSPRLQTNPKTDVHPWNPSFAHIRSRQLYFSPAD